MEVGTRVRFSKSAKAAIEEADVSNSELARRLGVTEGVVRRLLNFRHRWHIGQLETALAALGKRLVVDVQDAAGPKRHEGGREIGEPARGRSCGGKPGECG
jgi:ribosome-binding protein aMBF1 (putative translation factor)